MIKVAGFGACALCLLERLTQLHYQLTPFAPQLTIMALRESALPQNCSRTIYMCDDGKDPLKRDWVDSLGPDVIYVSGDLVNCTFGDAACLAVERSHPVVGTHSAGCNHENESSESDAWSSCNSRARTA